MPSFLYQRIIVIGSTSSGKSTLAEKLAKRFDLNFIDLDALHWEPGWQEAPLEVFRKRVETATRAPAWAVAGNYHIVRDLVWHKAEVIIWLDYSLPRILWQLTHRTFKRWWTREILWGSNRENLWSHFKLWSDESLYHWLFKTYWRRKREYPILLALPEHRHLKLIRFSRPHETDEWLKLFDREPTMNIEFVKLTKPTAEIAAAFSQWENDPELIPLIRPNPSMEALLRKDSVSINDIEERIKHNRIYLIYLTGQLIGTMDYEVDPAHLYKKETSTAWLGILIGEEAGRGRGIGYLALQYLEAQIKLEGIKRIELGVFEFNTHAVKLYKKLGYRELARIEGFTYWQDKMWQDIRMEKYI